MSDLLHDLEPGTATCRRGCAACAQTEADVSRGRRALELRRVQASVNRTLGDLAFIEQHGYAPFRVTSAVS